MSMPSSLTPSFLSANTVTPNLKRRKNIFPHLVDLSPHVLGIRSCGNHDVLVGYDYDILTRCTVCAECIVTASPHLIAVTLHPVLLYRVFPEFRKFVGVASCRYAINLF